MFQKDTFRLIKSTFNRFFSLFMMVVIGVAFMMGLMSTKIIMKGSVDAYNDKYKLQDLQLVSSYGFDEDDIDAIKKQEGLSGVFSSKFVDCYCKRATGSSTVTRVEEIERNVNELELVEGRFPNKSDEIVLLYASVYPSAYPVGTKVTLYLEKDDLSEQLKNLEYTIVGFAECPAYYSKALGNSTLDNKELSMVCFVPSDNFLEDYYKTVYLTLEGAEEYVSYTDEYKDFVSEEIMDIENFAAVQQEHRKAKIKDEYEEELRKGEEEFEEKKAEGQKALDDAKKELDDANVKLIFAQMQIDQNSATLNASRALIEENEKKLEANEKLLADAVAQVEAADPDGRSFDEIYEQVSAIYGVYQVLKTVSSSDIASEGLSISALEERNEEIRAQIDANDIEIKALETELETLDPQGENYEQESSRINGEIALLRVRNNTLEGEYNANLAAVTAMRNAGVSDVSGNIEDILAQLDAAAGGSVEESYAQISALKNGLDQVADGRAQLEAGKAELKAGEEQLYAYQATIASSRKQYEQGLKEYNDGVYEFNTEIEKAESDLKKARQELDDLPDAAWTILDRDSHYSSYMFKGSADQMGTIGVSLPVLFFLVAALVSMTTMTRLIDEQRGQIGIFRALGFSNGAIIGKYVVYSLLATLSGSVFGVVIGLAIFPTVIYNAWRLMYILPPMQIIVNIPILILCVSSFSLLLCGISALVVRKTLKEMPSQLMRPKAPKNAKPVFLEKIKFIWNKLSFTSKITARNIIRYKSRFFMTVIGVAGCTGLLVVGWGIKDSIGDIITIQFGRIFGYDYSVNIQDDRNLDEFMSVLEDDLDYRYMAPVMEFTSRLYGGKNDDQTMSVYVIDARRSDEVLDLRRPNGKTKIRLGNSGVIVSEKFANTNNIKKGDFITIESRLGVKAQVEVSDICEMYFQHYVFMSEVCYRNTFGEEIHPKYIAVCTENGEKLARDMKKIEGYVSTVDFSALISTFENMINALDFIILVIIVTAGALAFVVLINLTQVNISERMREIATLKVLGFRDGEVNSYLFKEIFLLSLIGAVLGLPLGVVEHHFIMNIISMDMVKFGNTVYPLSFAYAFGLTIAFTLLVLQMTKRSLRNIQMVESLKSVE